MVKEENQVKRLILKVFQHVIDFLLHISGLKEKSMDLVYNIMTNEVKRVEERLQELSLAYKMVHTNENELIALVDGKKSYVGIDEITAYVNLLDKEKGQWYYCDC